MSPLEAQQLLDDAECIVPESVVQAALDRLAGEIAHALAGELPLVLPVMGGCGGVCRAVAAEIEVSAGI